MNILLINPNMMKSPPVIPIGLEYLSTVLKNKNHEVEILDLCFSKNPEEELSQKLTQKTYDAAGLTIRNIDSALFYNNEFYLPSFKKLIEILRKCNIPIILGGAGFSAMPYEILDYLNAEYGIIGPGEVIFPLILDAIKKGPPTKKVYNGWQAGIDSDLIPIRAIDIDYTPYLERGGVLGFVTSYGCPNSCPYCIEANTNVHFRNILNIIEELKSLVNQGYTHFHTCDCEFNLNHQFSIQFCEALIKEKLDMKWALYMKPYPYSENLFRLLRQSGAYLITLTIDSYKEIQLANNYTDEDLRQIIEYCKKYEIKVAIDLLTGYPHEPAESTQRIINFLKKYRPSRVGIGYIYRVYNYTQLADLIRSDENLQQGLNRAYSKESSFLEPIFYRQPLKEIIEKCIEGDDLFEVSGITSGVNYQLTD
ncbi:MAG: B12-binding domain-containing radical SAM protein [Promethearchaeota archaeon]